ncbi:MAG: ribonuclease P protein component [Chitinophagaceae bacterium]
MAKQFTLGKNERLKSRKIIEELFSEGNKFVIPPFRVFYIYDNKTYSLHFGTGVSSKHFKKAVDRNRIKRMMREAYRLLKNELQSTLTGQNKQLNIFIIYAGKELPEYKEVYIKMEKVIHKLCTMLSNIQ